MLVDNFVSKHYFFAENRDEITGSSERLKFKQILLIVIKSIC